MTKHKYSGILQECDAVPQVPVSPIAWYGARVRSKSELSISALLAAKGVECFVPCWRQRRPYSDRVREVSVAVFPGYVFCKIELTQKIWVLNTAGVQSLAGTLRAPAAIDDDTIVALQKAFSLSDRVAKVPYLRCGDIVQVLDGPMTGATGILLRNKTKQRLVISLHLLQRSVEVEVDGANVTLLSRSRAPVQCDVVPEVVPVF
jgi:transcription antitermination factor NusG